MAKIKTGIVPIYSKALLKGLEIIKIIVTIIRSKLKGLTILKNRIKLEVGFFVS